MMHVTKINHIIIQIKIVRIDKIDRIIKIQEIIYKEIHKIVL